MIFHFFNNASALVVGRLLSHSGAGAEPALNPLWLGGAAAVLTLGLVRVLRSPLDVRPEPSGPRDR